MPLSNLPENQLFNDLPQALVALDQRNIISALVGGMQDRNEDLRTYISKYGLLYNALANTPETGVNVVQVVYTTPETSTLVTRSVNITASTPETPEDLIAWASAEISIPSDQIQSATKIIDPFRVLKTNTLALLAGSVGSVLFATTAQNAEERLKDSQRILEGHFLRLRLKGTANSFELLGRLVGWSDARFAPLWGRLSPRLADDVGNPDNDPDFGERAEIPPVAELPSAVYDPFQYRGGEVFYQYHSSFNPVTGSFDLLPLGMDPVTTDFLVVRVNYRQPYVKLVQTGVLVTELVAGTYILAGGEPFRKAWVDLGNGITVYALAEGEGFNGLQVVVNDQVAFTVDPSSDQCHTAIPHGLVTGELRSVTTTGTLPFGLSTTVFYGIRVLTTGENSTTFTLHPSRADALSGTRTINLTSEGSGEHHILMGNGTGTGLPGVVITVLDKLAAIQYRTSYYDLKLTMTPELINRLFCSPSVTVNSYLLPNPGSFIGNTPLGDDALPPALSPYRPYHGGVKGGVYNPYTTVTSSAVVRFQVPNPVQTVLNVGISSTDTILNVDSASEFPDTGDVLVGKEIMHYNSKNPPLNPTQFLGVTRGFNGTLAVAHDTGDKVTASLRQLDMAAVARFGDATFHYYEEVRPATRFPRRELTGLLLEDQLEYAPFQGSEDFFTTTGSLTYSGVALAAPLVVYKITFELVDALGVITPITAETDPVTGVLILKATLGLITVTGTYDLTANSYTLNLTASAPGLILRGFYRPQSSEMILTEPSNGIKVVNNLRYHVRPEDGGLDGCAEGVIFVLDTNQEEIVDSAGNLITL